MSRRCFISAPAALELAQIVQSLSARGWEPFVLSDVAKLGASLAESVQDAIREASVVIGLFTGLEGSANTAFEIGFATGLGKPVLLVVTPDAALPVDLSSYFYVQAEPDNVDAIVVGLEHLDRYGTSGTDSEIRSSAQPLGPYADQLLRESVALRDAPAKEFEALMVRAIESGNAVAVASAGLDRGFDIGVWSDDLDAIGANPLLIELKHHVDQGTVRQSLNALHMTPSARVVLVVSLDAYRPRDVEGLQWPVLWISLDDLLSRLRADTFAEVIRDLRNRSVHGLSR